MDGDGDNNLNTIGESEEDENQSDSEYVLLSNDPDEYVKYDLNDSKDSEGFENTNNDMVEENIYLASTALTRFELDYNACINQPSISQTSLAESSIPSNCICLEDVTHEISMEKDENVPVLSSNPSDNSFMSSQSPHLPPHPPKRTLAPLSEAWAQSVDWEAVQSKINSGVPLSLLSQNQTKGAVSHQDS